MWLAFKRITTGGGAASVMVSSLLSSQFYNTIIFCPQKDPHGWSNSFWCIETVILKSLVFQKDRFRFSLSQQGLSPCEWGWFKHSEWFGEWAYPKMQLHNLQSVLRRLLQSRKHACTTNMPAPHRLLLTTGSRRMFCGAGYFWSQWFVFPSKWQIRTGVCRGSVRNRGIVCDYSHKSDTHLLSWVQWGVVMGRHSSVGGYLNLWSCLDDLNQDFKVLMCS